MCGIIVVCMIGVFCKLWEEWARATWNMDVKIPLLTNPLNNNLQLRSIAMSWILNETIDSSTFSSAVSNSSTFLSNNINSDKHSWEKKLIHTIVDSDEDEFKMQSVEKTVLADLATRRLCVQNA